MSQAYPIPVSKKQGTRKADDEYSNKPKTLRERKRKADISGTEQAEWELLRKADQTYTSRAIKRLKRTVAYMTASLDQRILLEESEKQSCFNAR
jgi:hypothetical protein